MELLNIKMQPPEEYPGKIIRINSRSYIVGHLVGEGGRKLVYQLINAKSGLCHYVLSIPIDQELASGITKNEKSDPYCGMNCYDYYRNLAKKTYCHDGYDQRGALQIFTDFLDIKDFAYLENKYHGIFRVTEFFNDAGDDNTGGIYQRNLTDSLLLLKINLRKNSNDKKELHHLCKLCLTYLSNVNKNDDNIIETYIFSSLQILKKEDKFERNRIIKLTKKMLNIEPYFKRNIYTAVLAYSYFKMWKEVTSLFEYIKDVIYEPYSNEWFMIKIVYAYKMINDVENANKYLKYIRPDIRKKIMEK